MKENNKILNNPKYRNDPTWANGLISASKNVASGVMMLVRTCNATLRGDVEEEAIIALSSNVASATAQLVTASRVRADPNSGSQRNLDDSAKSVARATDKMVKTAKLYQDKHEHTDDILPANTSIIHKLEQQMSILRLEKQLEQARRNFTNQNKEDYKRTV